MSIHKINQNIYITNDEEIKYGDWVIDLFTGNYKILRPSTITKDSIIISPFHTYMNNGEMCKKIILTTDQDLIKDGVQAIDDEFLEWFVNNTSCEFVDVKSIFEANPKYKEETQLTEKVGYWSYKIIIPKEEIQPQQIWNEEKIEGVKKLIQEQETLEYDLLQHIKFCLECKNESQAIRLIEKYGFEKQEQDKKLYSEEDLDMFRKFMIQEQNFSKSCLDVFIEKFKNK